MPSVLIVDDEKVQTSILGDILTHEGYDVTTENNPEQALALAQNQSFDLVICDMKMPQMDGIESLKRLRKINPDLNVIIMTAFGTIETAVKAMREGAFDYVMKPFSKEELLITIQRAIKNQELVRENVYLREELGLLEDSVRLIGESEAIQNIHRMIAKVAQDDKATVLLQGETGTGKDLISRAIHQRSPRQKAAFIVVNCAAVPEGLMESEFFGHEKGAFTGAVTAKPGRFELADRGTLFLDEVAELDANVQGKLLRVLQTKEFERVGGTRTHRVNVRVIAATNKNLQEGVRSGRFREDLFYRLNVVPITIPPLRERKEDIPLLTEYFLKKFQAEGKRKVQISPDAMEALMKYNYPGNVRELENLLERAIILSDGKVVTSREVHLYPLDPPSPSNVPVAPEDGTKTNSLRDVSRHAAEEAERVLIMETLLKTNWNRVKAARALGIDYKTLRLKIRQFGLAPGKSLMP
ncbi:MAG TPA: sigma-54 dependent transcriptional regulator [Nitrospiria bacterium]|jgi:DNA-binding NtrC family response regulator|nr:sigma-54 dependent transcriptional regulator [Nitrospiria bacterium]